MNAPDKIYVGIQDLGSGYATSVSITPQEGHSEYLRKDALLECAEKELDRLYELIPDASNENPSQMELRYLGQYMQTEILIDKINEL